MASTADFHTSFGYITRSQPGVSRITEHMLLSPCTHRGAAIEKIPYYFQILISPCPAIVRRCHLMTTSESALASLAA